MKQAAPDLSRQKHSVINACDFVKTYGHFQKLIYATVAVSSHAFLLVRSSSLEIRWRGKSEDRSTRLIGEINKNLDF